MHPSFTCASVQVDTCSDGFTAANALSLVAAHDVVVDASDNAATRYLASDACVVAGRPLVSGAALGIDGQLTVYHYGSDGASLRSCLNPTQQNLHSFMHSWRRGAPGEGEEGGENQLDPFCRQPEAAGQGRALLVLAEPVYDSRQLGGCCRAMLQMLVPGAAGC